MDPQFSGAIPKKRVRLSIYKYLGNIVPKVHCSWIVAPKSLHDQLLICNIFIDSTEGVKVGSNSQYI